MFNPKQKINKNKFVLLVFITTFVLTKRKIHNMDYSKVKFVTPSVSAIGITKGKVYPVSGDVSGESSNELPEIIDDKGSVAVICIDMCSHLYGAHWIPCREDGTPLTNGLTELEAEMLDLLNRISGELLRSDFVLSEKWYDKIAETIKKAKQ